MAEEEAAEVGFLVEELPAVGAEGGGVVGEGAGGEAGEEAEGEVEGVDDGAGDEAAEEGGRGGELRDEPEGAGLG